jgi:hypothetical protein
MNHCKQARENKSSESSHSYEYVPPPVSFLRDHTGPSFRDTFPHGCASPPFSAISLTASGFTLHSSSSNSDAIPSTEFSDTLETAQTIASTLVSPPGEGQQTKRILGIFPNFRAVSANVHLPPQTVREKFITATQDSFDYSSIFIPAIVAGYSQATNATPEFH